MSERVTNWLIDCQAASLLAHWEPNLLCSNSAGKTGLPDSYCSCYPVQVHPTFTFKNPLLLLLSNVDHKLWKLVKHCIVVPRLDQSASSSAVPSSAPDGENIFSNCFVSTCSSKRAYLLAPSVDSCMLTTKDNENCPFYLPLRSFKSICMDTSIGCIDIFSV